MDERTQTQAVWLEHWILRVLVLILVAVISSWIVTLQSQVVSLQTGNVEEDKKISSLESVLPYINAHLASIDQKLEKMEHKEK